MFGFLNRSQGEAVRHQNGSLSYEEFNNLLGMMTDRLDAFGLSPGDRIAMASELQKTDPTIVNCL